MKMLLEIKLSTNFTSPTSLFKNDITVVLVGSAAFTVRTMGESRYMTLYLHTQFTTPEYC